MNIGIEFLKLRDNAQLPTKGSANAGAYDLFISEIEHTHHSQVTVKLGFATDIPEGWMARIQPRSSFSHRGWVMANSPAIIDSDYRGEWMLKFQAIPAEVIPTSNGEFYAENTSDEGVILRHRNPASILSYPIFPYVPGERIAQVIFEPVHHAVFIIVDKLTETTRGEGGFGSTGNREII